MQGSENKLIMRPQVELTCNVDTGEYYLLDKTVIHNVMVVPISAWLHMKMQLIKEFHTGSVLILQSIGKTIGSQSAKSLIDDPNADDTIRSIFSSVSKWGFGRYELLEFSPKRSIRFRLLSNIGRRVEQEESELYKDHFLIGFYGGYFSSFFRRDVTCKEISCMNIGDDYCEFEIS